MNTQGAVSSFNEGFLLRPACGEPSVWRQDGGGSASVLRHGSELHTIVQVSGIHQDVHELL